MILLFFTVCLALVRCIEFTTAGTVLLNSNAIKFGPAVATYSHAVSASPVELLSDSGNQNFAIDTVQAFLCVADEDCGDEEFCFLSRGACLQCKKRRKRCIRDAMCCPGNHCSNGLCQPYDFILQLGVEGHILVSTPQNDNTTGLQQPESTQNIKGLEGENCLRSSDCAEDLCCARHFWSKICKPVLKEGQVCTRHKRKGTHALEIFQRCDCGAGLVCKAQRGDHSRSSRSLHTCQ